MSKNRSKNKGSGFEREIVNFFRNEGFRSERARGSDGRSLGLHETVDLLIESYSVQAKRRKSLPKYLRMQPEFDMLICRQDFDTSVVLIPMALFAEIMHKAGYGNTEAQEKVFDALADAIELETITEEKESKWENRLTKSPTSKKSKKSKKTIKGV